MEWQPIETAPKDGTYVLLVVRGFLPMVGKWASVFGESRWDCLEEGRFAHGLRRISESYKYDPTHWMPLPDPPETDK